MSVIKIKGKRHRKEEHNRSDCAVANNCDDLSSNLHSLADEEGRTTDRRIARTQKLLRDALHSLIREKDYDSIVVKEILARADVGRSAFYTHFRDKDDLLVSSIHEILGAVPPIHSNAIQDRRDRILWFSLPIFEYHDRHRKLGALRLGERGRTILHAHLQNLLGQMIMNELRLGQRRLRKPAHVIPPEILALHIASTFVLVLNWWLASDSALSARQADECFRKLARPTLDAMGE